jgi:hypothetical protein
MRIDRGPGSLSTPVLLLLFPCFLLLLRCPCADAATYIPLTQAIKGSAVSADALATSGRTEGNNKASSSPSSLPSSSSSSRLRGSTAPSESDKGAEQGGGAAAWGAVAIHHPMTTLDPRLTAYFATVTLGGNQAMQLLVDTGR